MKRGARPVDALGYGELWRMARRYMWQQPADHTLQTTALIHEAHLRLVGQEDKHWESRAHFFGVAAQAMRHIVVHYARARHKGKRGGEACVVSLEEAAFVPEERAADWWRWTTRSRNLPDSRPDKAGWSNCVTSAA